MSNEKMTIRDIIYSMHRNHPIDASTFSQCSCGRMHRRGGEPCPLCLQDRLVAVGADVAHVVQWRRRLEKLVQAERDLISKYSDIEL